MYVRSGLLEDACGGVGQHLRHSCVLGICKAFGPPHAATQVLKKSLMVKNLGTQELL